MRLSCADNRSWPFRAAGQGDEMKLTLLGTGNAGVTACYNTCFVLNEGENFFLVDGGGGNMVLRQLKEAGIDTNEIHDIFVTHKHIDHLLGIIWIVRMITSAMGNGKYVGDARIYGHDEVLSLIREFVGKLLLEKEAGFLDDRLHLIEVRDGDCLDVIGHRTSFFDIGSTKAKQFGFMMEIGNGEKLTCCGDEPFSEREREYAQNSKWLLHEAFCLYANRERFRPYQKHHSTVRDACELAEQLNVQNLVLYHTEDTDLTNRKLRYTEEGKAFFHGNLFVPDDLDFFEL